MKKLVSLAAGVLFLRALVAAGCSPGGIAPNPGAEEEASSCITCHTDKGLLKEVAEVEVEEVSEETSGEG